MCLCISSAVCKESVRGVLDMCKVYSKCVALLWRLTVSTFYGAIFLRNTVLL